MRSGPGPAECDLRRSSCSASNRTDLLMHSGHPMTVGCQDQLAGAVWWVQARVTSYGWAAASQPRSIPMRRLLSWRSAAWCPAPRRGWCRSRRGHRARWSARRRLADAAGRRCGCCGPGGDRGAFLARGADDRAVPGVVLAGLCAVEALLVVAELAEGAGAEYVSDPRAGCDRSPPCCASCSLVRTA